MLAPVLYVLMWTVVLPPENNPILDDHLLGAVTLVALAALNAGDTWGFGRQWAGRVWSPSNPSFDSRHLTRPAVAPGTRGLRSSRLHMAISIRCDVGCELVTFPVGRR